MANELAKKNLETIRANEQFQPRTPHDWSSQRVHLDDCTCQRCGHLLVNTFAWIRECQRGVKQ
jgi:hypothetical protein